MITVPSIISDYARGNMGTLVYTLAIEPAAPDSWTEKRFSTASVTVDGEAYQKALAKSITRIVQKAKAVQFGSTAVFPSVSVKIINKDSIHEELGVNDHIVNRKATIQLTAISTNKCLNSNFAAGTGADADNWTEHASGLGGTVGRDGTYHYDGSYSCLIESTNATEGSWIECDPITMKRGQKVCVSFYARTASGVSPVLAALKLNTLYYDQITGTFGATRALNYLGLATTTFTRFDLTLDWADLNGTILYTEDSVDVVLEVWSAANTKYYIDAVQIEFTQKVTDYHHNRYGLVAADCLTMFTGIIKRPKWKASEFEFQLEAWSSNTHRQLPVEVVSNESDANWEIPKESVGVPFPITYGDFQGDGNPIWDSESENGVEFAKGILPNLDPEHADGITVNFDRPNISLYTGGHSKKLYIFNEDNNRYYEQAYFDNVGYSYSVIEFVWNVGSQARFQQASNPLWLPDKRIPLMARLRTKTRLRAAEGWTMEWQHIEGAHDGLITTYAYRVTQISSNCWMFLWLEDFPFDIEDIISDGNDVELYYLADIETYTETGAPNDIADIDFLIRDINANNSGINQSNIYHEGGTFPFNWSNLSWSSRYNKRLTEQKVDISDWNAAKTVFPAPVLAVYGRALETGSYHSTIKYYEGGLLVYFALDIKNLKYAGQIYGRVFEDTWGTRKTTGNLVETPSEVIESMARLELGAATADINTTQFDAVDTARSSYKVAGQVLELQKSQDIFKEICKEFGMIYHIDRLGRHSLIALDYPASVSDTLTPGDFIKPIKNLAISQTPRESVITSIKLRYDKNRFTGDYKKIAYCNRTNASGSIPGSYSTKCATAYAELGNVEQVLEIKCDWVNDTATAELIVKHIIDWNYLQRFIVTGPLAMDKINLEIGDYVSLYDFGKYLPSSVTTSSRFLVMETRFLRSKSQYVMVLLEVKEP